MGEANEKREKRERRFDPELLKKGLRCDLDQYDMLKRCSENKDITEWNEWLEKHGVQILLENADLREAHLNGAQLPGVHLMGADLSSANLEHAYLRRAHLQRTKLVGGHLERVNLYEANLTGAILKRVNLSRAILKGANVRNADLENADLRGANLQDADLQGCNLKNAVLWEAKLQGANLRETCLQGAKLMRAYLQGAEFGGARLQGADFSRAIVDGETLIWRCEVDRKTKFKGVGLDAARIYPELKQLLKYNIRRMNWEDWYKEHWFWRWPVQIFWAMSDYGMSTARVVGVFFLLAFLFAGIYANLAYWQPPGIVSNLEVQPEIGEAALHYFSRALIRPVYFSVVTMTTLGFGDMYANKGSIAGHVILAVQVILGYVLLGALVTRFAVLFTAGGPAGKFGVEKKEARG